MKVFISYSRKDAEFVERLKTALEAGKVGVTIDTDSLAFGDDLHEFVERSVRETDLTIAVISHNSLQSVWVIAEALETLMYEKVQRRKKYLPIYIDASFLDDGLYLQIVEQIDASLATLKDLTVQGMDSHLDTVHLDQKRQRFITLRNNLPTILKKLADVLVADFSSETKFAENLPKLLEAIAQAETQCEQVSGRPFRYLAPFQAPPLPAHFVPRPDITDALKARLLNSNAATPGVLVASAVHGLGGIGKSTLAAALSYDKEVQQRFPDGILWAKLGQQPEILSLISNWIQAMRDYDFRPTTIEAASAHLRTLLQDKAVLLVVDDAWNPEHAIHFKVGGPRCQVLITTRRADVADDVGADLHQMDVMTPEQALELLSARLGKTVWEDREQTEALRVAKAVGYLPLALELAAVRVARGMSWTALYEALEQEVANLEAFESSARRRRKGDTRLEACFNLSLRALRSEDEDAWNAFVWLGVLSEDAQIAAPMAATLWELTQEEATDILELLWNDALLMPGPPIFVSEKPWKSYRLHDLLHAIACRLITKPSPRGLDLTLTAAHDKLLKNYRNNIQHNQWHTLPNDGYIHAQFTWHLQKANQKEQIYALLQEETATGRNGWYQKREQLRQTAGFLEDVKLTWELATKASHIGQQLRCALIIASFNSLAKQISTPLIVALVEKNVWTPPQGLAYACQIPELAKRRNTLIELAEYLPDTLKTKALHEAIQTTKIMENIKERTELLIELIPNLSESLQKEALSEALKSGCKIKNAEDRMMLLIRLMPYLQSPLKETVSQKVLLSAKKMKDVNKKTKILAHLVPHLPDSLKKEVSQEVLEISKEDATHFIKMLRHLVPHLAESVLQDTLNFALICGDGGYHVRILTELARFLSESLLQEALASLRGIKEEKLQTEGLVKLAPYLSEALRHRALEAVERIEKIVIRDQSLAELTPYLSSVSLLNEALSIAQDIEKNYRSTAIVKILTQFAELNLLTRALTEAKTIENQSQRAKILANLAHYLPERLLKNGIVIAKTMPYASDRDRIFIGIACRFVELGKFENALALELMIENIADRADVLIKLVEKLEKNLRPENDTMLAESLTSESSGQFKTLRENISQEGLIVIKAIPGPKKKIEVFKKLIHYLEEPWLTEVLTAANTIEDIREHIYILAEIASKWISLGKPGKALGIVRDLRNERFQPDLLEQIIPHFQSEESLYESLEILQRFEKVEIQSRLKQKVACRLADIGNFEKALQIVKSIPHKGFQRHALAKLAFHLPGSLLREALQASQRIEDSEIQAHTLTGFTPYLCKPLIQETLSVLPAIKNSLSYDRALTQIVIRLFELGISKTSQELSHVMSMAKNYSQVLMEVALYLTKEQQHETAWAIAQGIKQTKKRDRILSQITMQFAESGKMEEAWSAAHTIIDIGFQAEIMAKLAPYLEKDRRKTTLKKAVKLVRKIHKDNSRAKTLTELGPSLSESFLKIAVTVAKSIKAMGYRIKALVGIAPYLSGEIKETIVGEILENAQTITNPGNQALVLISVIPSLPKSLLYKAESTIETIRDKYWKVKTLIALIAHFPEYEQKERILEKAIEVINSIREPEEQSRAISEVFFYLPIPVQKKLLQEIIKKSQRVSKTETQVKILVDILPFLENPLKEKTFLEIIAKITIIEKVKVREQLLNRIVPLFTEFDSSIRVYACQELLKNFLRHSREELLSELYVLTPIIADAELGGEDVIAEIFRAIQDVGRWWP